MKVYLCEDCSFQLTFYKDLIDKAIKKSDANISGFLAVEEPERILEDAELRQPGNVLFIDVNLGSGKMNGLELARKVKKVNSEAFFVFITTEDFMAYKTFEYQLNTLDYIVKKKEVFADSSLQKRVLLRICRVLEKIEGEKDKSIVIQNGATDIRFKLDEIVGISSVKGKHQIEVQYLNGCLKGNHSLKEIQEKLDSRFFMVSKSAFVNLMHVREWNSKNRFLIMDNGVKFEVSFRKISELNQRLRESVMICS